MKIQTHQDSFLILRIINIYYEVKTSRFPHANKYSNMKTTYHKQVTKESCFHLGCVPTSIFASYSKLLTLFIFT